MVDYMAAAAAVPGWREGAEAIAVYEASHSCPDNAVLVEVGSFLGRSTILLAGAPKRRGSCKVHAIDPFDGLGRRFLGSSLSGDPRGKRWPIDASPIRAEHQGCRAC